MSTVTYTPTTKWWAALHCVPTGYSIRPDVGLVVHMERGYIVELLTDVISGSVPGDPDAAEAMLWEFAVTDKDDDAGWAAMIADAQEVLDRALAQAADPARALGVGRTSKRLHRRSCGMVYLADSGMTAEFVHQRVIEFTALLTAEEGRRVWRPTRAGARAASASRTSARRSLPRRASPV